MIGEKLSPILVEIEEALWEHEANVQGQPHYSSDGFRAALKIFMSALMDKIYDFQCEEGMQRQDKMKMVQKAGEDIRQFVKTYTNIDTHDLYK